MRLLRAIASVMLLLVAMADNCSAIETLDNAWEIAAAANPGLTAAWLESDAARYSAEAAESEWWPTASLRTGYRHRSSDLSFRGSQPPFGAFVSPFAQRNAGSFSVRASQPLWTAGRIASSVNAARSKHAASEEGARWSAMQLRMSVAEAYVAVLQAQAAANAATYGVASADAHAADVGQRARQSRVTDTEVMAARVAVLEAKQRLLAAHSGVSSMLATYNRLLGRPAGQPAQLTEPIIPTVAEDLQELTSQAMSLRPDVLEIERIALSHESDAAGWRAARMPQVSAEVGFDYEENRFQSPQGVGTAGVFVDWSLTDGGKKKRLSAASSSKASAARALLKDLKSQVAVEVLRAWSEREVAHGAAAVCRDAFSHRLEQDRLVQQRHAQGLAVDAESIASREVVAQAGADCLRARTERGLAELRLRFVAGLLDESPLGAIPPAEPIQPAK